MAVLTGVVPRDAASVLQGQLTHVVTTSATAKGISLVVAIAVAVYGGMYAAMYAANG